MKKANDNGVPEDEFLLAITIQDANARGLRSTKGAEYRIGELECNTFNESVTSCCAVGAMRLSFAYERCRDICLINVADGNDGIRSDGIRSESNDYGYTLGQCFYDALRSGK